MLGPIKNKASIHFAFDVEGVIGHAVVDVPVDAVPTRKQLLVAVGAALAGMYQAPVQRGVGQSQMALEHQSLARRP